MKKYCITFIFLSGLILNAKGQFGCTDPQATNFNASATINDGSCTYNVTNLSLTAKANVSTPLLDENSGIEFIGTDLWTFNDGGNSNDIYRIDTVSNTVYQTVKITNASNIDWEDISSDSKYLYIGDFGNNNGDRHDLKIYRIKKSDLTPLAISVTADIINFSYSDQTTFTTLPNANNYDCESMIIYKDSIHLFSKNWSDKLCKHYVLPCNPGTSIAQLRETFNAGCLITGASVQQGSVIALCGYDNVVPAPVSLWILFDFNNNLFFNGNKRKFSLSTAISNGQVEGVSFKTNAYGFISNERFIQSIFNVAPMLKSFSLASFLPSSFLNPKPKSDFKSDYNPACKNQMVSFTDLSLGGPSSWQWTFTGGSPSTSTLQNPQVVYAVAGTYDVKLKVSNLNGVDSIVKTSFIKIAGLPSATINPSGNLSMCAGDSIKLTANNGTGLSYQWIKNGIEIAGATYKTFKAKKAGTYKVRTTNSSGCSNESSKAIVTINCKEGNTFENRLVLYPNPSNENFNIDFQTMDCLYFTLEVFDISGKLISSRKVNCNDIATFGEELNAGIYFLKISDKKITKYFRIIKTN